MRISNEALSVALRILAKTESCSYSMHCLWRDIEKCSSNQKQCPIVRLRNEIEEQSPALMGLYTEISRYRAVTHDYALMEMEGDEFQKQEARKNIRDLSRFKKISLIALLSLWARFEGIPYVTKETIEAVKKDFSLGMTIKELEEFDRQWVAFINAHCFNLEDQNFYNYKYSVFLLIRVFLEAAEPLRLRPEEIPELFREIKEFLTLNRA